MQTTLALLIPTLDCRRHLLERLLDCLTPQLGDGAYVPEPQRDNGQETIGAKRNRLIEQAVRDKADYVAFIDDDDTVAPNYVSSLLEALRGGPDAVGFRSAKFEQRLPTTSPMLAGSYIYRHEHEKCSDVREGEFWFHRRFIGHLQPVRTELAAATRFKDWSYGEDRDYAERLRPLIKSATFVDRELYQYHLRHEPCRAHEMVHPTRWRDDRQIRLQHLFPTGLPLA